MFLYFAFYYCFSTIITLLLYAYSYWSDREYYNEINNNDPENIYDRNMYYNECVENFNNPIVIIILILLLGYIIFPILIYALLREFWYEHSIRK